MKILGIETSCDDTCAAVVSGEGKILSNTIASSARFMELYGGVVPEIASRKHLELINTVIDDALKEAGTELNDIDLIAATQGPGLIGALLVGFSTAKALAAALGKPFVPVNHLQGHIFASTLQDPPIEVPFLVLVVSGGHTFLAKVEEYGSYEIISSTLDDAAGEAFDKGARMLGLGYPGGPIVDKLAREGNPQAYELPIPAPGDLDFSYSGLKTALYYKVREMSDEERKTRTPDLCASYQRAIVRSLVNRIEKALELTGLGRLALGGGVAANSELRETVQELGVPVWTPPISLCVDNAAMIAGAARYKEPIPYPDYLALDAEVRI